MLGMSYASAKNLVSLNKFPVPTYKLGRRRVVDRYVLKAFFAKQKTIGLGALKDAPVSLDGRRRPYIYKAKR